MKPTICILLLVFNSIAGCRFINEERKITDSTALPIDTLPYTSNSMLNNDSANLQVSSVAINTGSVQPQAVIEFAKTLIGIPYKYGSTDKAVGFDCSGFITYVFNHFNIKVPRSSIDFTNVGRTVDIDSARPGDIILFTGTDSTEKFIGHMGIIVSAQPGKTEFIHSTSGKAYGVTITPLSSYYMSRYMRTARIFKQNE